MNALGASHPSDANGANDTLDATEAIDAAKARAATRRVMDANEAVADVAYRMSEIVAVYPITPASPMGEHADRWATARRANLFGEVPSIVEMQSEAGAAGALHGALETGALATTFTASQGLLLMLPNLFKIAGELTPFCMHVAARTVATHALSIFGDHSDVMAARTTGMALLASSSPQQAQDLAAIAHATTLLARVPILHFFDGFRTSHEMQTIAALDHDDLRALVDDEAVRAHRSRSLDPNRPMIRGTSQNPDVYFQSREAVSPFYERFPSVLERVMSRFFERTGRRYRLFDYFGHDHAERVVVVMGSSSECARETVAALRKRGERVGVLTVHLFRPFSLAHFLAALPPTTTSLAVLDRTKEPGSAGEPLLQDVTSALVDAVASGSRASLPRIIGGRYGLASKDFTPAMAKAVFDELRAPAPKRRFTVGIRDDVSRSSLSYDSSFATEPDDVVRAVFFGLGSDGTVSANKASIAIIGEETPLFVQGYFEYDSKKSGSITVSHLRFGPRPIRSTYRIQSAQLVAVHATEILDRRDVLALAADGATVLLNTSSTANEVWPLLSRDVQQQLITRRCRLFVVDATKIARDVGLQNRINTVMQACFFKLAAVLPFDEAMAHLQRNVAETYAKLGADVVTKNVKALDAAVAGLREVRVPREATSARTRRSAVPPDAPAFVQRVTRILLEGHGDDLPVSAFPPDGAWPTGTSRFEKRALAHDIPLWQPDLCIECGFCSMSCPHAAIQTKVVDAASVAAAPIALPSIAQKIDASLGGARYLVQVAPEDCTGCGLCVEVCPAKDKTDPHRKALIEAPLTEHRDEERAKFEAFEKLPSVSLAHISVDKRTAPLHVPLFEFSGACAGCGETPYLRLLTQLFGDRMLIANATGCSSIYGGNLPTTPYAQDDEGRGPAWANSLFEDNAEQGLGMHAAAELRTQRALALLRTMKERVPSSLVDAIEAGVRAHDTSDAAIEAQRKRVDEVRALLANDATRAARALRDDADALVPTTVWIVGGDGWAYDIGFGGLDHVLSSGRNVKVLVLDTEVYSNTGGQQSKATPIGAIAKFAAGGKATKKKDLGLIAMTYGDVYVAQIAMQADSAHAVKALLEAESYRGASLVIAHCPCIEHGYDLVHAPTEQRRTINAGLWPLYRFDPRRADRNEPALVLDSGAPTVDVADVMKSEARFAVLMREQPAHAAELVDAARKAVRDRRALYEHLAARISRT